jgi:hypothetical protein
VELDWEGDTLILNGKKQTKAVSDKYRKYFKEGSYQFNNNKQKMVI